MTNDDRPSRPDTGMDPEQRAFYEFVLDAGRRDTAPEDLGARLLERIDHRSRIELYAAEARPRRRVLISAVCILLAAAAAALLVRRLKEPVSKIAAERPAASSGRPKTPVPDPCRSRISAPGGEPVIDDFEDGDDAIARLEQRVAFWRWAREIDAPGTAPALIPVPHPEATPDNRLAIHVKGGQLLDWGAAVEFTFRPACYDASGYAGIAFRARGPGRIYVAPREPAVIPIAEGGTCELDCHNPHVIKVDLDETFRSYDVRWEQMRMRGLGKPPLDPSRLNSLAFLVRPEDTPYDVWLDDVRFIRR